MNSVALDFTRFVLQTLPADAGFLDIYDAMTRAASARRFHNLGHAELSQVGVSFSLLNTANLEKLIAAARQMTSPE